MKNKIKVLFIAIGALGGYLYWRYVGCASGTCPITSSWYTSSLYWGVFGYFLGDVFTSKKKSASSEQTGTPVNKEDV